HEGLADAGNVLLRVGSRRDERRELRGALGQPALDLGDVLRDQVGEPGRVRHGVDRALFRLVLAPERGEHGERGERSAQTGAGRRTGQELHAAEHTTGRWQEKRRVGLLAGGGLWWGRRALPLGEPHPSPPQGDAPSRRLGRYDLRAKIADGGMAEVHVARRVEGPGAGEVVAIKTIREEFARNQDFVTMFIDEAKIVSRLKHPNVIRYHELGTDDGQLYLVMELLFGQSLWSLWEACRARGVRLRYAMIAWIGARAADGLHYAHELADENGVPLEIIHRDVNATNIFVTYDGAVKVIDFGLAKAANRASKTAAGVIKGKVAYMSPEQAVGAQIDRRTDVFALGTTLWELACDRRLFKRPDDVDTL